MRTAAADVVIELLPRPGFRSVTRPVKIIRRKLAEGQSIDEILQFVAAPGCSEHHTGNALDLGVPGHADLTVDLPAPGNFAGFDAALTALVFTCPTREMTHWQRL